jgi:hypothetical protein
MPLSTQALTALVEAALVSNRRDVLAKLLRCMPVRQCVEIAQHCIVRPRPRFRSCTRPMVPVQLTYHAVGVFRQHTLYRATVIPRRIMRQYYFTPTSTAQYVCGVTLATRFILRGWHWQRRRLTPTQLQTLRAVPGVLPSTRVTVWRRAKLAPGPQYAARYADRPWVQPVPWLSPEQRRPCTVCCGSTTPSTIHAALAEAVAHVTGVARAASVSALTWCARLGMEVADIDVLFFIDGGEHDAMLHCQDVADTNLSLPVSLQRPDAPPGLLPCVRQVEVKVAVMRTAWWSCNPHSPFPGSN